MALKKGKNLSLKYVIHTHTHTHTHIRMLKKIHFSNAHGTVRTSFTLVVVL